MKLAVFDCDGTLIDGQASICEAMETAFARHHLPLPPRNDVRRIVGLSLPQAVRALAPDADAGTQGEVVQAYKDAFRAARSAGTLSQPLIEGMAETLGRLAEAGWTMGVATGMSSRGLTHCLESLGIAHRFVTLQTADRNASKPHPEMLEAALSEAGARPAEAVMIGDTTYDMLMAREAGVRAIGVAWGYHGPDELIAAGAEFVADDTLQLEGHLLR